MKTKKTKIPTTVVRVSPAAKQHLERVVDARRAQGLSASGASVLNELILSIPLPEKEATPCGN
jgi:hypothetical protein